MCGDVLDDAAVLGAVQQLAEETATSVTKLQAELAGLRTLVNAQNGYLSLSDSGEVTVTGTDEERADEVGSVSQTTSKPGPRP